MEIYRETNSMLGMFCEHKGQSPQYHTYQDTFGTRHWDVSFPLIAHW